MQYREVDTNPRSVRTTRRANVADVRDDVEWADEESDLDPSYVPGESDASDASDASDDPRDDSDASGITLGSQDTDSDASDDSDATDLSGFIVDDDCVEWYSSDSADSN